MNDPAASNGKSNKADSADDQTKSEALATSEANFSDASASNTEDVAVGNVPPKNMNEQKAQLLDSLLDALYDNGSTTAQSLVTAGLQRIDDSGETGLPDERQVKRSGNLWRWQLFALAAVILILLAFAFPYFGSSKTAVAAVSRCIEQAISDVGRHYEISWSYRLSNGSTVERSAQLYVQGSDQFAVQAKAPLGQRDFWFGGNPDESWVVLPRRVLVGDVSQLDEWVAGRQESATPYLHISILLERMRDAYDLQEPTVESLVTSRGEFQCQHIVGTLRQDADGTGPQGSAPSRIELWADAKSGLAIQVEATWELAAGESGRQSAAISFVEEIEFKADFFDYQAHGGRDLPLLEF